MNRVIPIAPPCAGLFFAFRISKKATAKTVVANFILLLILQSVSEAVVFFYSLKTSLENFQNFGVGNLVVSAALFNRVGDERKHFFGRAKLTQGLGHPHFLDELLHGINACKSDFFVGFACGSTSQTFFAKRTN